MLLRTQHFCILGGLYITGISAQDDYGDGSETTCTINNGIHLHISNNDALCRIEERCAWLDLSRSEIGDIGVITVLDTVKHDSLPIEYIFMDETSIGDRSAIAVADVLKTDSLINEVWMAGNNIEDRGCIALMDSLVTNQALVGLSLQENRIGDECGFAIAKYLKRSGEDSTTVLIELNLESNRIGVSGASAILAGLEDVIASGTETLIQRILLDNNPAIPNHLVTKIEGALKEISKLRDQDHSWKIKPEPADDYYGHDEF